MSRTHRKPRWYVEHSDASFINRELSYYVRRPYRMVKRRKSDEEYRRQCDKAMQEHLEDVRKNGPTELVRTYCWADSSVKFVERPKQPRWVSRHYYERVDYSVDECIADALKERKELTRDGKMSESGRRTGFKKTAAKEVRREWRKMKQKILKGEDYDKYYPHDKIGKKFVWSFW